MKITWRLTHEPVAGSDGLEPSTQDESARSPEPQPDFTALDEGRPIGRVYQFTEGVQRGLWVWSITAVPAGPPSDIATSGLASTGGKAGRALVLSYRALLERSWRGRVRP